MGSKLTPYDATMIPVFREFFSRSEVAREYGVHRDTIRNVEKGVSFSTLVSRRKDRKLSDDEIRQIRLWEGQGHREHAITTLLENKVSRSTVRQVLNGQSYQDVT